MAYAILTEGMPAEARAAFDLTLNAEPDVKAAPRRAAPSVAALNREAVRSWAALGVPIQVAE